MLLLSGLPLAPWETIIKDQLPASELDKFTKAFQQKDALTFNKIIPDLPLPYWKDITQTPPLSKILKEISKHSPKAKFFIYHGTEDKATLWSYVKNFENENSKNRKSQKPHLNWQGRYYIAGHFLNNAAIDDMVYALLAHL